MVASGGFEADVLAISELRRGMLQSLSDPLPSPRGEANERIGEGYVVSTGEEALHGLGVASKELIER
jgi:hypothetical protein